MQHVMQQVNGGSQSPVVPQVALGGNFKEFFHMNPSEFQGSLNALKARDSLSNMERVLQIVPCNGDNKVTFSSHMLKGPAARWWKSSSTFMINEGIPRYWEHFKTSFLDKYFLGSLRTHKEIKFQQLRQGNMSVAEYAENFENMVDYSRKVVYAPDEKWKMDQFMFGLRGEIYHIIYHREFTNYAELLRQCYVAKNSLKKGSKGARSVQIWSKGPRKTRPLV